MRSIAIIAAVLLAASAEAQLPNTISRTDKVFALSKFWQEVNYNFVYLDKVDRRAWDSTYRALIPLVQETQNDYDYFRLLQKFSALLKDGHTNIYPSDTVGKLMLTSMFGKYRLIITNVDGRAIITATNLSIKDEVPVGSEIITVNGQPTAEYSRTHVVPYISTSTDYVLQDMAMSQLLLGVQGQRFDITIRTPAGILKSLSLVHDRTAESEIYPPAEQASLMEVRWYDGSIGYVALNSFNDPKIDSMFIAKLPELSRARALIIDLRKNGGGSTDIGRTILDYLTPDSLLYGSKEITRSHLPAYKAWGAFVKPKDTANSSWKRLSYLHFIDRVYHTFDYKPEPNAAKGKRIVVPTALLVSHHTASAAEDFLIYADNQKHMTRIGERSFGSTGQPLLFKLPGGGSAGVCTKKDTFPDGREFVGVGVAPHIEVKTTIEDWMKHNDPVLNKALEYLRTKL